MRPSIAIITTVYNEDVLLPLWLRYYGAQLGREHLYIIDDGSTDGSVTGLSGVNVIRLEREPIDQDTRALAVSLFHNALQQHYDAVIFADVDEFLVIDPLLGLGLADYVGRHAGAHTNALGLNLVHNQFVEPPYTSDQPVLAQRSFAEFSRGYCKQLIHKEPVFWLPGFHNTNQKTSLGVGLYLFHLRALDYELSRKRINNRNRLPWSERALQLGQGEQNRLADTDYLRQFFHDHPRAFEAALPQSAFNTTAMKAAGLIAASRPLDDPSFRQLEAPVLTVPSRFSDSLPAATSTTPGDADRGPALVSAEQAAQYYHDGRERIRHKGMSYHREG